MLTGFLTNIIAALLPAASDGLRALIGRLTGADPSEPKTAAERIELTKADTERLKALAEIDKPVGSPSQWVVDLRGAFRYVAALVIFLYGFIMLGYLAYTDPELRKLIMIGSMEFVQAAFFFAFGDRVYRTLRGK